MRPGHTGSDLVTAVPLSLTLSHKGRGNFCYSAFGDSFNRFMPIIFRMYFS
jgi:hypothetical protein